MIIKAALIVFLVLALGFMVWMNLTSGYFRAGGICGCEVVYSQKENTMFCPGSADPCGKGPGRISSELLKMLAILDFNK